MMDIEKELLDRLNSGEFDTNCLGNPIMRKDSITWTAIKNGIPVVMKQIAGSKCYNNNCGETEVSPDRFKKMREWATDEEKIAFLRKCGCFIEDAAVKAYYDMFKSQK